MQLRLFCAGFSDGVNNSHRLHASRGSAISASDTGVLLVYCTSDSHPALFRAHSFHTMNYQTGLQQQSPGIQPHNSPFLPNTKHWSSDISQVLVPLECFWSLQWLRCWIYVNCSNARKSYYFSGVQNLLRKIGLFLLQRAWELLMM